MTEGQSELVELLERPKDVLAKWQPIIGPETEALREQLRIPEGEKSRVINEAVSILSRCVSPTGANERLTGLVIGYVQSGKTMSFTAVTALARDNGYQMVIVIAGTSTNLLAQSTERLRKELRLETRDDRQWQHFESRKIKPTDFTKFRDTLQDWRDSAIPREQKKTILLTVMKHHGHLHTVRSVLAKLDLTHVPVLIIDDEADQASLNAKVRKGNTSATYERIVSLRECLPTHTFLQYTATPQAPLLINIIDVLSPRFVNVVTPGEAYRGAKTFFLERPELATVIPNDELLDEQGEDLGPPESLKVAMQIFFLGVASGFLQDDGKGNRSMLVHPSHKTLPHEQFHLWIERIRAHWQKELDLPDSDADKQDLLSEFDSAYRDLRDTEPNIPTFPELLHRLPQAIRQTQVEVVNAGRGKTPTIEWNNAYSHILVGGQAMDRGFTVEGLTVTYMPRGTGTGNVDTILQRARFFGYKARYIDYCRIFLEERVFDAYVNLVKHEEDIRERLTTWSAEGKPLSEWKRAFFLDAKLRPTRSSVIDLEYARGNFANQWFYPRAPHDSPNAIVENRELVDGFMKELTFMTSEGHPSRTNEQLHSVAHGIPLQQVFEDLLVPLRVTRLSDSQLYTGLRLQIKAHIEKAPNDTCVVYHMSKGNSRMRSVDDKDEILNLFQGSNPEKGKGEIIYPGDQSIRSENELTIQVHNIKVRQKDGTYIENVPTVAVWVPRIMAEDWIVQEQSAGN